MACSETITKEASCAMRDLAGKGGVGSLVEAIVGEGAAWG